MAEIDAVLGPLVAATAPDLITLNGVGTDTAGALIVAAGDNPERLRNEATFAHLCGVSPLDASSGKQLHTGSTAAGTARPTPPSGASCSPGWRRTREPSATSNGGARRASPRPSHAVSEALRRPRSLLLPGPARGSLTTLRASVVDFPDLGIVAKAGHEGERPEVLNIRTGSPRLKDVTDAAEHVGGIRKAMTFRYRDCDIKTDVASEHLALSHRGRGRRQEPEHSALLGMTVRKHRHRLPLGGGDLPTTSIRISSNGRMAARRGVGEIDIQVETERWCPMPPVRAAPQAYGC